MLLFLLPVKYLSIKWYLPQFKKTERKGRNEKHPILKEEKRINTVLKALKSSNKIYQELYEELRSKGSQPARIYGLAIRKHSYEASTFNARISLPQSR